MRKRHFLCKEITDMQWEVTDGKVSEKDGHTDMERTGMKTAIKKGIKIYSPKIKNKRKVKDLFRLSAKTSGEYFFVSFGRPGEKSSRSRRCLLWKQLWLSLYFCLESVPCLE